MASFQASLVWWIWPTMVRAWPACGCRGKLSTNVSSTCRASTQRFSFFSDGPIWNMASCDRLVAAAADEVQLQVGLRRLERPLQARAGRSAAIFIDGLLGQRVDRIVDRQLVPHQDRLLVVAAALQLLRDAPQHLRRSRRCRGWSGYLAGHRPQLPRRADELPAGQRGADGADRAGLGQEAVGQLPLGLLLAGLAPWGSRPIDLGQLRPCGGEPRRRPRPASPAWSSSCSIGLAAQASRSRAISSRSCGSCASVGIVGQEAHGQGRRPLPLGQAPPVADHRPGSRRGPAAAVGVSA